MSCRRYRSLLLLLLSALLLLPGADSWAQDTGLPTELSTLLDSARIPAENVALLVAPVGGPAAGPRLSWRRTQPMNPASVMKLVTTYAGLDLLGGGYFWKTRFYTRGIVEDGRLHGDLIIRGSGDPKLVWDRLIEWFSDAHQKGLQSIEGDIVLDNSVFRLPPHDASAFDGEALRPYNVGPDGLLLNFKTLTFKFHPDPGLRQAHIETEPPIAGVQLPRAVRLNDQSCGDWRSGLQAALAQADAFSFAGSFPSRCGEQEWSVAYPDPFNYAPRVVQAVWQASGGELSGRVRWANETDHARPDTQQIFLTGYSLPLADIIADINEYSNNVMAQQLFLSLSADGSQPASFERSKGIVQDWWQRTFPGLAAPVMDNGSGLSRQGRISADALGALLEAATHHPEGLVFEQSLPIVGVNGTARGVASRNPGSLAIRRARIKTGTLRDTVAVAGYAWGLSGQQYLVVGLINDPNAPAARKVLDRLLEWAVEDL